MPKGINSLEKRRKAFTLAEFQIASLITILVITAALSLYVFYWRTMIISNTILDVYSNARVAVELMARDIRWAAQVVPSHGSYTTGDHSIVLQLPAIDNQGNSIRSHYDYVTYRLQGTDLYRIVEKDASSSRAAENRPIAKYCASLTFSSGGTPLSQITNLSTINTVSIYAPLNKTALSLTGSGLFTADATPTTTIRLRNK